MLHCTPDGTKERPGRVVEVEIPRTWIRVRSAETCAYFSISLHRENGGNNVNVDKAGKRPLSPPLLFRLYSPSGTKLESGTKWSATFNPYSLDRCGGEGIRTKHFPRKATGAEDLSLSSRNTLNLLFMQICVESIAMKGGE
jgi:hypothetical protein